MLAKILSLLLLVPLLIEKQTTHGANTPVVEVDPSPLNVSVNAKANFSCVVSNADVVLWFVNESSIDTLKNFDDEQDMMKIDNNTNSSSYMYSLSFVVERSFETLLNNSGIKCVGLAFLNNYVYNESTAAVLRIQGVLGSPSNISVNIGTDAVSISWLPPYTLKGIVIYEYEVNVTVHSCSRIIDEQDNSTVKEIITFPLVDHSACTVYGSSIQARSDAGLGHSATVDVINKYEVPKMLNSSEIGVEVLFTAGEILLQFAIEQDNCAGRRAELINATMEYATNFTSTGIVPAEANDDGQIIVKASIPKSAQGNMVSTIITLTNREGSSNSEPKLTALASTEKVTFTTEGSIVSLQCLFAYFSDAKGCHVVLECISNYRNVDMLIFNLTVKKDSFISEPGNMTCTVSSCATYNIYAYDITSTGSIGVQAWAKLGMILCPPPKYTSHPFTSPSASMTPEPNSSKQLLTIIMVSVALGILIFAGLFCLAVAWYWRKYISKIRRICKRSEEDEELLNTNQVEDEED